MAQCRSSLHQVAKALQAYASDHQGEYPGSNQHLVPDYLDSIPDCPVVPGRKPGLTLSMDRKWFGLHCDANHNAQRNGKLMFVSLTGGTDFKAPAFEMWNPRACQALLSKRGKHVRRHLIQYGEFPAQLLRGDGTSRCADYHAFITEGTEYEIVCTSGNHIQSGLLPLYPRFISSTHVVDTEAVEYIPTDKPPMSRNAKAFAFVTLCFTVTLALVWWRKVGPNRHKKVGPESNDPMLQAFED